MEMRRQPANLSRTLDIADISRYIVDFCRYIANIYTCIANIFRGALLQLYNQTTNLISLVLNLHYKQLDLSLCSIIDIKKSHSFKFTYN